MRTSGLSGRCFIATTCSHAARLDDGELPGRRLRRRKRHVCRQRLLRHGTCAVQGNIELCTCNAGYAARPARAVRQGMCWMRRRGHAYREGPAPRTTPAGPRTCDDTSGSVVCACDAGYAGVYCASCAAGRHDDGTGTCIVDEACLPNSCTGHGTCTIVGGASPAAVRRLRRRPL